MNNTDMGNILYFKQDHPDAGNKGLAKVDIVSFVITFECTDKFNENLKPGVNSLTSGVSCLALPFQTQRVDLGQIKQETIKGYTSYKYKYSNVTDLKADFLLYEEAGIVGGSAQQDLLA
jgi:hypothetical protein